MRSVVCPLFPLSDRPILPPWTPERGCVGNVPSEAAQGKSGETDLRANRQLTSSVYEENRWSGLQ